MILSRVAKRMDCQDREGHFTPKKKKKKVVSRDGVFARLTTCPSPRLPGFWKPGPLGASIKRGFEIHRRPLERGWWIFACVGPEFAKRTSAAALGDIHAKHYRGAAVVLISKMAAIVKQASRFIRYTQKPSTVCCVGVSRRDCELYTRTLTRASAPASIRIMRFACRSTLCAAKGFRALLVGPRVPRCEQSLSAVPNPSTVASCLRKRAVVTCRAVKPDRGVVGKRLKKVDHTVLSPEPGRSWRKPCEGTWARGLVEYDPL